MIEQLMRLADQMADDLAGTVDWDVCHDRTDKTYLESRAALQTALEQALAPTPFQQEVGRVFGTERRVFTTTAICQSTAPAATPDILTIRNDTLIEVIRIAPNGDLFWKDRLVETDNAFKAAMLDLAQALSAPLIRIGAIDEMP
jgi:hypothetical protein